MVASYDFDTRYGAVVYSIGQFCGAIKDNYYEAKHREYGAMIDIVSVAPYYHCMLCGYHHAPCP